MIAIVDYGMGNLRSVEKALEKMGFPSQLVSTPEEIEAASKLILPGVGAFGDAMKGLQEKGLVAPLRQYAESGKPLFGICLGMQIFFETSEEDPGIDGLGILKGAVRRFPPTDGLKVPHMGWNNLTVRENTRCFGTLPENAFVYFVHSYYVCPEDQNVPAATADYGVRFTAAVEYKNVAGTQFHPEKSQENGLKILESFATPLKTLRRKPGPPAAVRAESHSSRKWTLSLFACSLTISPDRP